MSHGKCTKCNKTVYLQEGFKVGPPGKELPFHKICFKCSNPGCTWQLNLTNYKFCDGKAFCQNHNPMTGFSNQTVKSSGTTSFEDKNIKMHTEAPKLDNMKSNVMIGEGKNSQQETLTNMHGKNAPRQGVNTNQNIRGGGSTTNSNTLDLSGQHAQNVPKIGVNTNQNIRGGGSTTNSNTLDLSSKHALNVPKIGVNNNQNLRGGSSNNQPVREEIVEVIEEKVQVKEEPIEKKVEEKKVTPKKVDPPSKIECLGGKRWNVENFKGNKEIKLDNVERTQVVYLYNLQDCIVEVTAEKFASISVDKVVRTGIKFNKSIGSLEVVNSSKVQIQGSAPSYIIDKSDSITLFLGMEDTQSQVVSSKAEINIILLQNDEPEETAIPSQFITTFDKKTSKWITEPVAHVGA